MTAPLTPYPEERRLATVLFADIQGFTQLADRLDVEEVSDLIKEIWLRLDAIIESHGGYIDKHIGDAVMGVWGAPQAREDDAERAVAAALALQNSLAEYAAQTSHEAARGLRARVGVNTGQVLSGYVGTRNEYTVIGDTVNVASRLEHIAEPGSVVISESTFRLVRGTFQMRRLPPVQLKGKPEPLPIYLVESALSQPTRVRYHNSGGLETRLVARDAELNRLHELYDQSRSAEAPVLVLVEGEAGLGKSRLLMEFTSQLEVDEPGLTLLSARGLSQASRVPFFVWKSLWHNRFGLRDNDPPDSTREKFVRGIQILWGRGLGPASAVEAAHLIGSLIGLEWSNSPYLAPLSHDPEARVRRAVQLSRELFRRTCTTGPTVLLLDDVHLIDGASLDLLMDLCQPDGDPLPVLILGAIRPGVVRHPSLLARAADIIPLNPLPVTAEVVMAAYPSLGGQSAAILAELARRAEGNPYFLEEMVKSLAPAKSGADYVVEQLPTSLQAVLQARLDALSAGARSVALLASVVGRVFWNGAVLAAARQSTGTGLLHSPQDAEALDEVIRQGLAELARAELAFPRAGSVFAGEYEYIFKHSLLRDAGYNLLPHKHRRPYHLAVARWLAARAGPDLLAMVAEHLEQAGVYPEAAQRYQQAAAYALTQRAAGEAAWLEARAQELMSKPPGTGTLRGQ
jgi:class 3 adenylate cyclase